MTAAKADLRLMFQKGKGNSSAKKRQRRELPTRKVMELEIHGVEAVSSGRGIRRDGDGTGRQGWRSYLSVSWGASTRW